MTAQPSRRAVRSPRRWPAPSRVGSAARTGGGRSRRPAAPVSHDPALHAARRLSYGATPTLVAHIRAIGLAAWLDEQLDDARPDLQGALAAPLVGLPLPDRRAQPTDGGRAAADSRRARSRARRGAIASCTSCWSSSGPTTCPSAATWSGRSRSPTTASSSAPTRSARSATCWSPARRARRCCATSTTTSRSALRPTRTTPASCSSCTRSGLAAGYAARDIRDAARALTGLTINPGTLEFQYQPAWHYSGRLQRDGLVARQQRPGQGRRGGDLPGALPRRPPGHRPADRHQAGPPVRLRPAVRRRWSQHSQGLPVERDGDRADGAPRAALAGVRAQRGQEEPAPVRVGHRAVRALGAAAGSSTPPTPPSGAACCGELGQAPFEWPPPGRLPGCRRPPGASTQHHARAWNTAQALAHGPIPGIRPPDVAALLGSPAPATGASPRRPPGPPAARAPSALGHGVGAAAVCGLAGRDAAGCRHGAAADARRSRP